MLEGQTCWPKKPVPIMTAWGFESLSERNAGVGLWEITSLTWKTRRVRFPPPALASVVATEPTLFVTGFVSVHFGLRLVIGLRLAIALSAVPSDASTVLTPVGADEGFSHRGTHWFTSVQQLTDQEPEDMLFQRAVELLGIGRVKDGPEVFSTTGLSKLKGVSTSCHEQTLHQNGEMVEW